MPFKYPIVLLLYIPIAVLTVMLIRRTMIGFRTPKEREEFVRRNRFIKRFLIISRLCIFLLLVIAMASPFNFEERPVKGDLTLTILVDNSTSFALFDAEVSERLRAAIESKIPVTVKTVGTGEISAIGDSILSNIQGNDNFLLVTDGNTNYGKSLGDVILFASNLNTTINALDLAPKRTDAVVWAEGPSEAIVGSETVFSVKVNSVGKHSPYRLTVDIDGSTVLEQSSQGAQEFALTQILPQGYHRMTARIAVSGEDSFADNNVFYKSVHIVEQPKVLLITKKTAPLHTHLSSLYRITTVATVPQDFSDATAIILDDIPAGDLNDDAVQRLTNYVTDGGGLVAIGGKNSYDKGGYKGAIIETLLPVKAGQGDPEEKKETSIVIVVDISGSTGNKFTDKSGNVVVDVEKALAVSTLDNIKADDKVGVIAFNSEAYLVSPFAPLSDKAAVVDRISRLKHGGGTRVESGLARAREMLLRAQGSRNIILISDGITLDPLAAVKEADLAQAAGINTFAIGVGPRTYDDLMKAVARVGHGIYFKAEDASRIKIVFGEPDKEDKDSKNLIILNANHFITEDLELDGVVNGYNQVVPKGSANLLVTTGDGKAILTAWRFGLGRVASLSTDSGSEWAQTLVRVGNSKIISRTLNWAIGDPTRRGVDIFAEDTTLGKSATITVRGDRQPTSKEIEFVKVDKDRYAATFTPTQTGFFQFLDAVVAVNYNDEYLQIGMNPDLQNLVEATGGEMFKEEEVTTIIEKLKTHSQRLQSQEISLRWPFLAIALGLFLFEVMVRRIREFRRVSN